MILAIVPAYNEAKTIGSVVRNLFLRVDQVVVVDDYSDDDTAVLAASAGAVVLRHSLNRGQGAALETGQAYARRIGAEAVIHFDADGQFDAEDIPFALAALKESGADVLLGSRFLDTRSEVPFFKRYTVLPFARLVNFLFTGFFLTDAHNGFRVLTKHAFERIEVTQDRMAHATEIPAQIKKQKLSFIEFPVKVVYREYGQPATAGLKIIQDLLVSRFIK